MSHRTVRILALPKDDLMVCLGKWYHNVLVLRCDRVHLTTAQPQSGRVKSVKGQYAPRINEICSIEKQLTSDGECKG